MATSPEVLLISSVLRDGDIQSAIKQNVSYELFHSCNDEWQWISDYWQKHRKIPTKTAFKEKFPEFSIKTVNDTKHYSDEVRKNHARIMLTSSMRDVADLIADGNIDGAVKAMSINMVQVSATIGSVTNDSDIITSFDDIYEEVAKRKERVSTLGSAGIPTGFTTLDERTGGAQAGHIWIVGARLGSGKSWCMMKMATTAIMAGYNVQYNALEQTRAEVAMRVHSFLSSDIGKESFRNLDLMQGRNFDIKKYHAFLKSLGKEVRGRLHVSDTSRGRVSPLTIQTQIEKNKPDIVYIDYLTLMEQQGKGDWQSVAQLSGDLKNLAMEYQVPIIAASQLNRANGTGTKEVAGADALSQSDSIGQDADVVVNLLLSSSSVIQMKCVKNRHGMSGFKWYNQFQPSKGIFKEVSRTKADELKDEDQDQADQEQEN